jgi:glycosyltransferase involved in cell wall biosynthesis
MIKRLATNKLLIVSRGAPPVISGSSSVVENLIKAFSPNDILVLSEKFLDERKNIKRQELKRIKHISIAVKLNWYGSSLFRKIQIPSSFILLLFYTISFRPKSIILIYPSAEYLLLGLLLSKFYKCNYYSYFHNTYLENRHGIKKKIAEILQNRIFKLSRSIFVISNGLLNHYKSKYTEYYKFQILPHIFTESLPVEIKSEIKPQLKLALIGNINESCREAAERMLKSLAKYENVTFQIFSKIPAKYFNQLGIQNEKLILQFPVDRTIFLELLRDCDIMLLPHGFDGKLPELEYATIFPSKTVEYLISGKPILYHGPRYAFITKFLEENKCALIIDKKDEFEISRAFQLLINDEQLRISLVRNSLKIAEIFQLKNVIKEMKDHLS